MHRLRFMLLLMLLIGLPLKGLAAASTLFCAPLHHHSAPVAALDAVHGGSPHHHSGHDHAAHEDDHGGAAHAHHAVTATDGAASLDLGDSTQCGACATCGAHAVAASSTPVAPDSLVIPRDATPFRNPLHGGLFTYGLERPPKTFLV